MFYTYTDISVIGCSWQIISVNDIGWVLVMSTEKNSKNNDFIKT